MRMGPGERRLAGEALLWPVYNPGFQNGSPLSGSVLLCLRYTPTSPLLAGARTIQFAQLGNNFAYSCRVQDNSAESSVCLSTLQPTDQQSQLMYHSMPQFRPAVLVYTFTISDKPQTLCLSDSITSRKHFLPPTRTELVWKNHPAAYIQARMSQLTV